MNSVSNTRIVSIRPSGDGPFALMIGLDIPDSSSLTATRRRLRNDAVSVSLSNFEALPLLGRPERSGPNYRYLYNIPSLSRFPGGARLAALREKI